MLESTILMHHMMVAQQSFYAICVVKCLARLFIYVIGKLGDRRRGYYSNLSSHTSHVYKCAVAIYTNAL